MKKFTRVLACACALLLAIGSLTGCFGGKKKLPDKQTVDHVYKYEQKELYKIARPDEEKEDVTEREEIYYTLSDVNGYMFLVWRGDKNYNDIGYTLHYGKFDGEDKSIELPVAEDADSYISYGSFARFEEGFALVEQRDILIDKENYVYDQQSNLQIYGEDGTLQSTVDLRKAFGVPDDGYINVERVLRHDDTLYLSCYGDNGMTLQTMSLDGTLGKTIPVFPDGTEGYMNNMFFTADGKMIVCASIYGTDSTKSLIITLDLATGARTELDTKNDYWLANSLFVGPDGTLYCSDQNGIYTVDPTTLAKTEILNYINSDYIYNYSNYTVLPDGRIATFRGNYNAGVMTSTYAVTIFTKVPDDQITPKYLITVASAGYAYNLQEQIVKYNLASDEYRIRFVDYSQYNTDDDPDAGQTRLGDDILAGNVPDVLIADQQFSVSKYVSKGLFADLYTFIDKDESMKREDFLENILAGCEIDGKLYEIPTNFYIQGLIGPKETIDAFRNLTIREFVDKLSTLPEGVTFFRDGDITRETLLQLLFLTNYQNFIDRKTGKCSINNDECRALLEFAKMMPEKSLWDREGFDSSTFDWDAYNNMYKEGKAIAQISGLTDFFGFENMSYTFGTLETDLVGLPSRDRNGYAFSATQLKFLLSAKSPFAEEGWKFIRQFFTDDVQTSLEYGFPVTVSALNAAKQAALDKIEKRAAEQKEGTGEVNGYMIGDNGVTIPIYDRGTRYETAADVEHIYDIVMSTKKQLGYDESIYNVIMEEASAYFSGEKSVEEVTKLINNRVGIILTENR